MRTYIKITILTLFACFIVSCEDFVEIKNYGGIPADEFVTSVANAQTVLNGAYGGLWGGNLFYFGIYYYMDLATNELDFRASDEGVIPLTNFGYTDGSGFVKQYWKDLYTIVARADDACSKMYILRKTLPESEVQKLDQLIGECNFLRAFAYFYLVRSFGDKMPSAPGYSQDELGVPIVDSLIVSVNQYKIPRNTLNECWSKVAHDFEAAYNLLPESWPNEKLGAATKGAAAGYLGQVYMYLKEYGKAKSWFEKAMSCRNQQNKGTYELVKNYAWNFDFNHENNSESVFEVQSQMRDDTSLDSYLWRRLGPDGLGFGMVAVSQTYVDKFSAGYQLTQEIFDELMPKNFRTAENIILREILNEYKPYIGVVARTRNDFFALYTGGWDQLGDRINVVLSAAKFKLDVKTEYAWGTVDYSAVQKIVNKVALDTDPRMYDSFYVPGRDSVASDWAATKVTPYPNAYYGFKKYIPFNAVESWSGQKPSLPGFDGHNNVNQRIFRLADLYLQYAEACYRQGDITTAKNYLNKVKRRAWGYAFDDASLSTPVLVDYLSEAVSGDFMEALIAEREKELCLEGVLWFDYLRWNKAEALFKDRGFDPKKHHRLPIPLSERQIAGMNILLQNSYY